MMMKEYRKTLKISLKAIIIVLLCSCIFSVNALPPDSTIKHHLPVEQMIVQENIIQNTLPQKYLSIHQNTIKKRGCWECLEWDEIIEWSFRSFTFRTVFGPAYMEGIGTITADDMLDSIFETGSLSYEFAMLNLHIDDSEMTFEEVQDQILLCDEGCESCPEDAPNDETCTYCENIEVTYCEEIQYQGQTYLVVDYTRWFERGLCYPHVEEYCIQWVFNPDCEYQSQPIFFE